MKPAARTRISPRARKTILSLAEDGRTVYEIVNHMNGTRMKPPGGGPWQRTTLRYLLKQAGVYRPRPAPETSSEALTLIVKLGADGARIPDVIVALAESGLKPARGGEWKDSTVRRILSKHGLAPARRQSDADRFQRNVTVARNGCHLWTGRMHGDGYGLFDVDGRNVLAHRWNFEQRHGQMVAGDHLHHICNQTRCVRAEHLLPVPPGGHRELELQEDAVEEAFRVGALREEAEAVTDLGWPGMPAYGRSVGSLRAEEVPV